MNHADIITAINGAGASITTDGMAVTVRPISAVSQIVRDELARSAAADRPALIAHLIERGRVHGPGTEAAQLAVRLTRGLDMLFDLEQRGEIETPRYRQAHTLFERLLGEYETAWDRAEVAA